MKTSFCVNLTLSLSVLITNTSCKSRNTDERQEAPTTIATATTTAAELGETPEANKSGVSHVTLMRDPKDASLMLSPTNAHLKYYGGPVLSNVDVIPVFWTSSVDAQVQEEIPPFLATLTASSFFDWLSEYNTTIPGGTQQEIGYGTAGAAVTINPFNTSKSLADTAIEAELEKQILAGNLPAPTANTLYMAYFPSGYKVISGNLESCKQICGFHGTFRHGSSMAYYGAIANLGDAGCNSGCGGAPNVFDNTTSVSSHELIEAVTDPGAGLAKSIAPPLGWYDSANGEIGDICNGQQGTITDSTGKSFVVQSEWSDAAKACIVDKAEHPPAISLKVNGIVGHAKVHQGASLDFTWTSTSAVTVTSTIKVNSPDACKSSTKKVPWIVNSPGGSFSQTAASCMVGHVYTYTLTAKNLNGATATSVFTLTVVK